MSWVAVTYNQALSDWSACVDALERNERELDNLELAYAIARFTLELVEAEQEFAADPADEA